MSTADFARALRSARKAAGLSQNDLARKIGVTFMAVSHWEVGRNYPRAEQLIKLCQVLDLQINEIKENEYEK